MYLFYCLIFSSLLYSCIFAEEVECLEDNLFFGLTVERYVTYIVEEGEVDDAIAVLLVVLHQFIELLVLLALEVKGSVVVLYEVENLLQEFFRESAIYIR